MVRVITLDEPFLPVQNDLGEGENANRCSKLERSGGMMIYCSYPMVGCLWDSKTGLLHWVDIFRSTIHTLVHGPRTRLVHERRRHFTKTNYANHVPVSRLILLDRLDPKTMNHSVDDYSECDTVITSLIQLKDGSGVSSPSCPC
jgi:hypothetical protein